MQWFWIVVLPIGVIFAPEAPWWLVRKGRYEDAKKVTRRLLAADQWTDAYGDQQVALMRYTTALEKSQVAGAKWFDCFKGANLRRTEIVSVAGDDKAYTQACMAYAIQWLSGDNMIAYAILFFQKAGLGESSFSVALI